MNKLKSDKTKELINNFNSYYELSCRDLKPLSYDEDQLKTKSGISVINSLFEKEVYKNHQAIFDFSRHVNGLKLGDGILYALLSGEIYNQYLIKVKDAREYINIKKVAINNKKTNKTKVL